MFHAYEGVGYVCYRVSSQGLEVGGLEERGLLECSFRMGWDEDEIRARIHGLSERVTWWVQPGPIGARRGVVVVLRGEMWAEIWRNSGQPVFGAAVGQDAGAHAGVDAGLEAGAGTLFTMEISFPAGGLSDGGASHREVRDRILRQLGAVSSYDYALGQIAAAEADKREFLELSEQGLDELPPEIGRLTELVGLDLSGNRLTGLPVEIGRLAKMEELILCRNRLSELPVEICRMVRLRRLDVTENRFCSFPEEIGELTELRMLHAADNQLVELPKGIGKLGMLNQLWVQRNQIRELPAEMRFLEKLNDFDFSKKRLPPRFPWGLMVKGNPLVEPPEDVVRMGAGAVRAYFKGRE